MSTRGMERDVYWRVVTARSAGGRAVVVELLVWLSEPEVRLLRVLLLLLCELVSMVVLGLVALLLGNGEAPGWGWMAGPWPPLREWFPGGPARREGGEKPPIVGVGGVGGFPSCLCMILARSWF